MAVLVLPGCGDDKAAQAGGAAQQQQMPAPEVGVIVAKVATVGVVTELPGRVEASRTAQVRARAAGILNKRLFTEGSDVKTGQLLMQIDAAPYQAEVQSAKANLARAEAALVQSKAVVDRYRPLVSVNAVSQLDFDNADATFKAAQAEVAAARAAVRTAEINLGYANVTAPISGRIGRALVTEGALVGQGETTPLAVIQQIDPVYVNFTQSTTEVLKLRRDLQDGRLVRAAGGEAARVSVLLDDGSDYGEPGRLLFTDLTVDPTSSQVTLRAELPNPDGLLLPGMYVRVRLEQAQVANAISVPQQAVTRSQQGDTLTVVDAEGNRQVRSVKLGDAASDNRWVVLEGLQEGEQVMVDGFQRVGMMPPGTKVKAVPWSAPGAPAPSAAAAEAPASGTEASANAKQ
nr:efflux RND transporter periplasmic adaptor subunit [Corticibacter populi]